MNKKKLLQEAEKNIKLQRLINLFAGFLFLTPVVTLLYKFTGLGLPEITLIANAATLCTWLFELPTSVFADVSGRKKSLLYSVICNLLGAILIVAFPSFWGFIGASVFAALYWSFWSGTGQAFLEENLRVLGQEKTFGKVLGGLMIAEQFAGLLCPLIASGILYVFHDNGYRILAGMDVVGAIILVILTLQLKDILPVTQNISGIKNTIYTYFSTAKTAISNVFTNKDIRLLILYRSFANHVAYLPLVIFPVLSDIHMPNYTAGIIAALSTGAMMLVLKFGHRISEKYSYAHSWVLATCLQALLLLLAAVTLENWVILTILYVLFIGLDGLWQPAWNHVLVEVVGGKAIATTRSLVFSIFALYTTMGKQVLSFMPLWIAFVFLAVVIFTTNLFFAKRVLALGK